MEKIFKDALSHFRGADTNLHPLISSHWSYKKAPKLKKDFTKKEGKSAEAESLVDKVKQLDSMEVFGSDTKMVEKLIKKEEVSTHTLESTSVSIKLEDIVNLYREHLDQEFLECKIQELNLKKDIKILFVTDDFCEEKLIPDGIPGIFGVYFDANVARLFYKMTQAMQLELKDFSITSYLINDEQSKERLFGEVCIHRPQIIMTLGAGAYQSLSHSKGRLKDVHGRFVELDITSNELNHKCQLMPIFSPKLLQTAPNMKKTAWLDMQKAMEYLK